MTKDNKINKIKKNGSLADSAVQITLIIILVLYCFSLLVPISWMLINSLKGRIEYYQNLPFSLPQSFNIENYKFILENFNYTITTTKGKLVYTLPWMLFYSIVYSISSPLFAITLTTMCAYVISRYKFPGRNFLYSLGIIIMIFPIIGAGGSGMILRRALGIYDNMFLLIITSPCMAFSGMYFLIIYAAFKSVPWEYAEAVFIDGGGHLRVFFTIMLPMTIPSIMVLVLLSVIASWNDYQTFLILLPSYANIAIGVYKFQYMASLLGTSTPQILASFVLVSIPIVVLYISFQKIITTKFMVGGLKG